MVRKKKLPKPKWKFVKVFIRSDSDPIFTAYILDCKWSDDIIKSVIAVKKWSGNCYLAIDFQNDTLPCHNRIIMNDDLIILKKI